MEDDRVEIERRLTELEIKYTGISKILNAHDEAIEKNSDLIGAIKELAIETKYMREDLNKTIQRLDKLENRDADKWEKFKWLIVAGLVTLILGYLAVQTGLK